jgi:uncharacterized protein involved in exopolysaccharide biosynthesis
MTELFEATSLNLPGQLRRVLRRKWSVGAATLLGALAGLAIALVIPPIYESEVGIQIGSVAGELFEDPYTFAEYLKSVDPTGPGMTTAGVVRADVVESAIPGRRPVYVKVFARGPSADGARELARHVARAAIERHQPKSEKALRSADEHQQTLQRQQHMVEREITLMQDLLRKLTNGGAARAPEALLVEARLEGKHEELRRVAGELSEAKTQQLLDSSTVEIVQATLPAAPVWPRSAAISAVAAAFAFVLSVAATLLEANRPSRAKTETQETHV